MTKTQIARLLAKQKAKQDMKKVIDTDKDTEDRLLSRTIELEKVFKAYTNPKGGGIA